MKKLWQFSVRMIFRILLRVLRFTPWKVAYVWATMLGTVGFHLSARYRNVADKNLRMAYGDQLNERDRKALVKRVFQNFSKAALVDFLKAPSLSPDQVRRIVPVTPEQFDLYKSCLARGKGMIVVSAHIGNWEMLARRGAIEGFSFAVVVRQSHDVGLNEVTDYVRISGGYEIYARGNSAKQILQRLRGGGIIAILPDQKSEDVFVPFFGRLTGTVAGPAVLALKTGAPIVAVFCLHNADGTYTIEGPIEIDTTPTDNPDADKQRIMADITAEIERVIRLYPDQWLWLHDRWKAPVPEHLLKLNEEPAPVS